MVSDAPKANETELHALLHGELDLTTGQEAKLERIEADFAGRRRALELEMRAANVRLAQAIEAEQGYGRSEEHKSELHPLMRISSAVFDLQKKKEHTHLRLRTD